MRLVDGLDPVRTENEASPSARDAAAHAVLVRRAAERAEVEGPAVVQRRCARRVADARNGVADLDFPDSPIVARTPLSYGGAA